MRKLPIICLCGILVAITSCVPYQVPRNVTPQEAAVYNKDCRRLCGIGYFYDRLGYKNNGNEVVCTRYSLKCGYSCTKYWRYNYLVYGTNYTCQDAEQSYDYDRYKEQSNKDSKSEKDKSN